MNILITICARGGSKGVKNKNIKKLSGKPLIAYTIEIAKKWGKAKRIICSTDSENIAKVAKKYGAKVPFMRPKELAIDTSGKLPAIRHAFKMAEKIFNEKYDLIIDLDVTAPIRTIKDLDNCLRLFKKKKPEVLFSVVNARKNPYFNIVEEKDDGFITLSKKLTNPILRRQDSPEVYELNASIYFYSRNYLIDEKNKMVTLSKQAAIYIMNEYSTFDIDSELDFKVVEFLINQKVIEL